MTPTPSLELTGVPLRTPRLGLGPIVGHTDHQSTRIWLQTDHRRADYHLRIRGVGRFQFEWTEGDPTEFGTAVATATGLESGRQYRYDILYGGRRVPNGSGRFQTMPDPGSLGDVVFVALSCAHTTKQGAWPLLRKFIAAAKPKFLLMMGDQVYLDEVENTWKEHLNSPPAKRRAAMFKRYRQAWSKEPLRTIMANVPTYMVWDDHEIRDGWGSWALDSPTLAGRYPRAKKLTAAANQYFEDARSVYWHCQRSHGPDHASQAPPAGSRRAAPFFIRCGRLAVAVTDARGDRDLWRPEDPVLGTAQWNSLRQFTSSLSTDIEAVVFVTTVPIAVMSPEAPAQVLLGNRTDDVRLLQSNKPERILNLMSHSGGKASAIAAVAEYYQPLLPYNSDSRLKDIDDVRDQWSNRVSRPEQTELIRLARSAIGSGLSTGRREVLFVGGDVHVGAEVDIVFNPGSQRIKCLVSSGISQDVPPWYAAFVGVVGNDEFRIAPDITANVTNFIPANNFGVIQAVFTGKGALIKSAVAHAGTAAYLKLEL